MKIKTTFVLLTLLLLSSFAYAAVEKQSVKSDITLAPGQSETVTIGSSDDVELGWETTQEKKCTTNCVQATDVSTGTGNNSFSTALGASIKYKPANDKVIIEYKNVGPAPVKINVYKVKRVCDAEACAFLKENDPTTRGLVFKIAEFKSIQTSADHSYSTITGVTTTGKDFSVKAVWWTDEKNGMMFPCADFIQKYLDNKTPPATYSPYILSARAVGYKDIVLEFVDTCVPNAPNFGVSEDSVFNGYETPATDEHFDPTVFNTSAEFSLDGRKLTTTSALAILTDEFYGGQTTGLKILFFTKPLNEEGKAHILNYRTNTYDASMILFLGKDNTVWQIDVSYVVPGQTATATVAYKAEELKEFLSEYSFDGTHLKLKSKGSHTNNDPKSILTWDVNLDAPVFPSLKKTK